MVSSGSGYPTREWLPESTRHVDHQLDRLGIDRRIYRRQDRKNQSEGLFLDIVFVEAFVGCWLLELAGRSGVTGFNLYSMFVAVFAATVVLAAGHAVRRLSG